MKTWTKPEVTALDVDKTLAAGITSQTENFDNFFSALFTFLGDPAGS